MEKYAQVRELSEKEHKRLIGVTHATFSEMVSVCETNLKTTKIKVGRTPKLSIGDQLLMLLEYYREYRTFFHIAQSYGLSESNAFRTIRKLEDILIKSRKFALPGKKSLISPDTEIEEIVVDATESKIERPKKNKSGIIPARRSNII